MTRFLDIALSFFALALLWPLMLLVAIAVRLDSRGPALFRQRRVGRYGREFTIYKFRSMRVAQKGERGLGITATGDRRVTRLGRVLRKHKIDELPQLWNVLIGEMSLVGPRPESPEYVAMYSDEQRRVLRFRPGVTDAASLMMIDEERLLAESDDPEAYYLSVLLPLKTRLAYESASRTGVWSYLRQITRTLCAVVARPR